MREIITDRLEDKKKKICDKVLTLRFVSINIYVA